MAFLGANPLSDTPLFPGVLALILLWGSLTVWSRLQVRRWRLAGRELGFQVRSVPRSCRLRGRLGRVEIRYLWGPFETWDPRPRSPEASTNVTHLGLVVAEYADGAALPVERLTAALEGLERQGPFDLTEERLRWRPRRSRSWSRKRIVRTLRELAEILEKARG